MATSTPDETFELETSGAVIRGARRGNGEPFVLLHGGPGCYDYFAGTVVADWLAERFAVYSYDQRGCRDSRSEGPHTAEANVADLEALRRWIGAEPSEAQASQPGFHRRGAGATRSGRGRLNLLGHSAGALLAMHYAAAHPHLVDRLVLVSPAGLRGDWMRSFDATIRERLTTEQRRALDELELRISREVDRQERTELYRERFNVALPCYVDPGHRDAAPKLAHYSREVNVQLGASLREAARNDAWRAGLKAFQGRACIIHGRTDPIPWRVVEDTATLFSAVEVRALARCGHFPWLEEPTAFRRALVAFLDTTV